MSIDVANWLKRCVYVRMQTSWAKVPMTFLVSAVWHGFHVGYYTTFLSSVFLTSCARMMRKRFRGYFVGGSLSRFKLVYDIAGRVLSMFLLNYLVVSFIMERAGTCVLT